MEIKRNLYLNKLIDRKHNGLIKVITGIRRCGKSYLLNTLFYNHLVSEGVKEDHIIKFAFDSAEDLNKINEDLIEIDESKRKVDAKKFMDYISSKVNDKDMYYLLLDEVQNLGSFEAVLNSYIRSSNLDVYVTGSNSKFLSSDVITEFAGRGDEVHIFPLTFAEFFSVYDGSKEDAYEEYSLYGGLPALVNIKSEEQKVTYLESQMKNVYLRDIVKRYNLGNGENISELLDIISSGISTLVNPLKLANTFKSLKNVSISVNTISNYIHYLEEAFIVSCVKRYDVKGKKYINTPFKIYFEDIGLRNARINFRQFEETHIMENIIYNELRYRGFNVDVGMVEITEKINNGDRTKKQYEIDFVANKGSNRYYIQSAYDIPDKEKYLQETRSFENTRDYFKKIIIVNKTMKPRRDEQGYLFIGIKEFLLDINSLEK